MTELGAVDAPIDGPDISIAAGKPDIPTAGEYAQRLLATFERLLAAGQEPDSQALPRTRHDALEFIRLVLALARKFPHQFRLVFESSLPFTHLEIALMRSAELSADELSELTALRIVRWAAQFPLFLEDGDAPVSAFLDHLVPHLDLLSDREKTVEMATRLRFYSR